MQKTKDNSDYIMTCINKIISTSNTLKKLLLHKILHYSYTKIEFNEKEEIINNTFITNFELLLQDINHPAFLQECKLNLDAAVYEKEIDANLYKPSDKKEIYRHDSNLYWPTSIKDTIQWFTFLAIIEHTSNILKSNKGLIP